MARVHTGESVLARTVRIVESFRSDDSLLTVSEIARRSGLHISTTSRLIDELVGCGWLEREDRKVRIGVRLWEVASRASPTLGLREAAMPFMEDLHAVVGQHTQLGVLEGDEVLFIERLTAPGAVVNYTRIAGRMPLHVSSSGLVLLAHGPSELQERILGEPLKVFTDKTIRTPRQLRGVLADVRRHGYILCAGHLYPDTTGVAVPVRDGTGKVVAALSVVVPNDEKAYAQIPALQAAAKGITRVMATASK
ncbi:IclR family transcriptional regulator [Rhodococcus opacus]|uniref:IclR family transcriptional regulator n=1 Tax=Rhodococcus opacus TaxID=37919 RepID=UPI001C459FAA|nr:IclR family transcriptional regulator [Rhodococcus opacus]MBV6761610.1 IclR family transcriptional regulator [Rhodococcus opacus]